MLDLSIHATDAADLYRQIRDLAGPAILEGYQDEALLAEVRQRMAKKGFVVVIKPFEDDTSATDTATNGDTPEPPKGNKRGPKPKTAEPTQALAAPDAPKGGPKLVEPSTDTAKAMTEKSTDAAPAATQDDVKAALNAYAAIHGQMPARAVMQKEGGCPRLMDIPPAKYGAVIAALAVQVAA